MDDKPLMPRRPAGFDPVARPAEKRKPEKLKPLKAKDRKSPEQAEMECLTLTEEQLACLILCVKKDRESAAIDLNMSMTEVKEIMDSAAGRLWLTKFHEDTRHELAKMSAKSMVKVGATRSNIEGRLMELMMLDPSQTKGNIDGQVKAANTLLTRCGYGKENDPTENMTPEELQKLVLSKARFIEGNRTEPVN
jgi:hypothetical protein